MESDAQLAARRVGGSVGRYRLEQVLGVGGMAAVYAGRAADGSWAAIKILHPEMSVRRDVRERFYREGYVANSIQHPGVVYVLEHGDAGEAGAFLAMELLQGETLTERVRRAGTLPIPELVDVADQVLDVLRSAHAKGVVHRDLKPDNLFVTYNGQIKILDFGLARLAEGVPNDHRTRSGVALGTLPYMAPEQALGRRAEIDGRVDLFALGATMFRILAGRKVHEAESEAELLMAMASKSAPPLASVCPQLPPDLCKIVDLALAFSRDARYPDATTMQTDVRAFRAGLAPPYAHARVSTRDEKTRAEPAFDPAATASGHGPRGTLPLAQHPGAAALSERKGLQFGQTYPQGAANPAGLGTTFPSASPAIGGAGPALPAGQLGQTFPSAGSGAPANLGQTFPAGSSGVVALGATYPSAGTPNAVLGGTGAQAPGYAVNPVVPGIVEAQAPGGPLPHAGVNAGLGQTYPSAGSPGPLEVNAPPSSNKGPPPSPQIPPAAAGKSRALLWVLVGLGVLLSVGMAAALWAFVGSRVAAHGEGAPPASASGGALPLANAPSAAPPVADQPRLVASGEASSGSAGTPGAALAPGAAAPPAAGSAVSGLVASPNAARAGVAAAPRAATSSAKASAAAQAAAAAPAAAAPAAAPSVSNPVPVPVPVPVPAPAPAPAPADLAPPAAPAPANDVPRSVLPRVRGKRSQN